MFFGTQCSVISGGGRNATEHDMKPYI